MATNTLNTRIIMCAKTTAQWNSTTTVPMKGEMCIEWATEDTNTLPKIKVGDGTNVYKDLPYATFTEKEIKSFISQAAFNLEPATASKLGGVKIGTNVTVAADGTISVPNATTSKAGAMSSTDKSKLDGIATGAEVNQNAFSNVKVGATTVAADTKTDTLELVAGSNITLTPDATNDKITIVATDTTYSDATQSAHGLMSVADKKKLDAIEAGADVTSFTLNNSTTITSGSNIDLLGTETVETLAEDGTVTNIEIKILDATTSQKGIVQLSDAVNSSSSTTAATSKAVKEAYDKASSAVSTVKQDGITGATVNRFGTSSTAAGTAAKTASITTGTFTLEAGSRVTIKFTNANTANSPTLNVNGTGAKNVFHRGTQITSGVNKALLAGTCDFVYDGTQWNLVGNYYDTTYSAATTTANGLMSSADKTKLNNIETGADVTSIDVIDGNGNKSATLTSGSAIVFRNTSVVTDENGYANVTILGASTSQSGIVELNTATNSTSTTQAATPSAVKSAYDLANNAMPKSGGTFTGAVTLNADPTANLGAATKQYVDTQITQKLAASDAMVFKGTLGTGGTVTAVPTTNVTKGDTYKVISEGTHAGFTCKVGDLLIAMTSGASVTANTTNWAYVPSGDETTTTIKYSTTTQNLTTSAKTGDITVGEAATKQVDTSISAASTSTKLPTSQAVAAFVEGKGYLTSSGTIDKAKQLNTAHNFSITGGATAANVSFNGTQDVALNVTKVSTTVLEVPSGDTLILDGNFT